MKARWSCALALFCLLLLGTGPARTGAQGTAPPTPTCPNQPRLPSADEEEVRRQADPLLAAYRRDLFGGWDIVAVSGRDDWGVISIAPRTRQGEGLPGDGDILLARRVEGAWRVVLPDTPEFRDWLAEVPVELLVPFPERGRFAVSAVPEAASTGLYRLPYECGRTALASRAGPYHDNAIDFLIAGVSFGGEVVVAAQEGVVYQVVQDYTACCCLSDLGLNSVVVQHPNGEFSYYLHLAAGSVTVQVGEPVYQGQPIAREGDVGYTCSSAGGLCRSRYCDVPGDYDYCCEHLHFEVRDNGNWQGARLEPRFADVPGEFVQTGQSYTSGNCCSETIPPVTTHAFSGVPGEGGWYSSPVQVTLTAQDEGGSGVRATYYRLDGSGWLTYSAPFTVDAEGWHTLTYYSVDHCGNEETPRSPIGLGVDLHDPRNPTIVRPACAAANNAWQNRCNDAAFVWSGAWDALSGVRDYAFYWGPLPDGQPVSYTVQPFFDPGPLAEGTPYFLRLAARDRAGRLAHPATRFVLRYDASPPTITSFLASGGLSTTQQVTVRLDLAAGDDASGLEAMRFSNNGLDWSPWQPFSSQATWVLPGLDRRTYTVSVQVRDRAGNVASAEDEIALVLAPPPPHSASFRLCAGVVDMGGSAEYSSGGYRLAAAVGQPWAGGAVGGSSTGFAAQGGFLAAISGCRPLSWTVEPVTLTQWVGGSGGNVRGGGNWRLGDTAGQAATGVLGSAGFRLAGGFWATITGTVPLPPPATPPPIFPPTPTPAPLPTRPPSDFGLSINGGYSFTNRAEVTLTLLAPHVAWARVSNAPDWEGVFWQRYRPTRTWTISTAGPYREPRLVYAQYRDAAGTVYGDYVDGIVYDPVPPSGRVEVLEQGTITVTLWLTATDDNSGVDGMRLAGEEGGLAGARWMPFASSAVFTPTARWVYAQFRDRAGNLSAAVSAVLPWRIYLPLVVRH